MKNGTASKMDIGQLAELAAAIIRQLPHIEGLGEVAHGWVGNGAALKKALAEALVPQVTAVSEPVRSWREQGRVIYFSVTSDGATGEERIKRLESKGFRIGNYAKSVLRSDGFKPTNGVTTEIAVLKGSFFIDSDRITKNIRAEADRRKLTKPNAEVACLIREKFTDKEIEAMGLWWIVTMHEPIKDSGGDSGLLCASRGGDGRWLGAHYDFPDDGWSRGGGFAFAVSSNFAGSGEARQVSS